MRPHNTIPLWVWLILVCLLAAWTLHEYLARKRFLAAVKAMAEGGQNEIDGRPVEGCLGVLNQDNAQSIVANDTMVLIFKGCKFFFVDGGIACKRTRWRFEKAFLLIAIGQPAVSVLSEDDRMFRRIAGTQELAVFSIYRWNDFSYMLTAEKKR